MRIAAFKYKSPNFSKLKYYGFSECNGTYTYVTTILDGQFEMSVRISRGDEISATVIDIVTDEPYTLHLVTEAVGAFVGQVRNEFESVLADIAEKCFESDVFKGDIAHGLIEYVRERYGDELEFLWKKIPSGAIWRRKDNGKWYAVIMTVSAEKLGLDDGGEKIALDFRINPETDSEVPDGRRYFKGYHMNKRNWMTVRLDGSVPLDEIKDWIDKSYILVGKK